MSSGIPPPYPLQRSIMSRPVQPRRLTSGSISKSSVNSPGSSTLQPQQPTVHHAIPRTQTLSPTMNKSPAGLVQGGITPPGVDMQAQQLPQPPLKGRNQPARMPHGFPSSISAPSTQTATPSTSDGSRGSEVSSTTGSHSNYYPSPYQTQMEQLGKLSRPLFSVCSS